MTEEAVEGEEETIVIHLEETLLEMAAVNAVQRITGLENVQTLNSKVIQTVSSAVK